MASPRVFISSTCFDLAEVRDSLVSFCYGFGFEVVLSERGDVFYHPDLHTHESCVGEISNCQLFILIIGGRFGGRYKVDPDKSITNAEYNAAKESGIPVFTFVKDGVLSDHYVYQKNREKEFAGDISYPSIENQEYAESIFRFIDLVRGAKVNNGFFGFKYAKDIHESLRKQWAGLFFEFLVRRSVSNQLESTNESIANLSIASRKIEELIKGIYMQVDEAGASASISAIDAESQAIKFFDYVAKQINDSSFIPVDKLETLVDFKPDAWWEFLLELGGFEYVPEIYSGERSTSALIHEGSVSIVSDISGDLTKSEEQIRKKLESYYRVFNGLSNEAREKVMNKYLDIPF